MLNTEELLKPRIKVIEPWPDMADHGYFLNQIITLSSYDPVTKQWFIQSGITKTYDSYFEQYPHLFKKLEWWEGMAKKELPEYLKSKNGDVGKVEKWKSNNEADGSYYAIVGRYAWDCRYFLQATREEYEQYLSQQTNK